MNVLESCKEKYKDSQQFFEDKDATLFLTHFGELDSEKITKLSSKSEEHLIEIGAAKRTVRNIFNILIEVYKTLLIMVIPHLTENSCLFLIWENSTTNTLFRFQT